MAKKYDFISDPGHGWMKVPIREIKQLGIASQISQFSYYSGEYAYLEEDCDAAVFYNAMKAQGKEVEFNFININHTSRIRNMRRFFPGICQ